MLQKSDISMRKFLNIFLFLFVFIVVSKAGEVFDRHFIVVVDQTITDRSIGGDSKIQMRELYEGLRAIFTSTALPEGLDMESTFLPTPEMKPFDTNRDVVSLFSFGLMGDYSPHTGDYGRIWTKCYTLSLNKNIDTDKHNENILSEIYHSLIGCRQRYFSNESHNADNSVLKDCTFDDFLEHNLYSLFSKQDVKAKECQTGHPISLSHFVYPLVLKFIPKDETANEYYIIIVSDFKSGLSSNNDSEDYKRLSEMCSNYTSKFLPYFKTQLKVLRSPFATVDYFHLQANGVGAKCYRLMMKSSIQKPELYLTTGLSIDESSVGEFCVSKAKINFTRDELTTIDSIGVVVKNNDGKILYHATLDNDCYQVDSHEISVKEITYNWNVISPTSADVFYIVYTMSHDKEGYEVLPVALTVSQSVTNITTINQQLRKNMAIIFSLLFFIAVIVLLYGFGLKKKVVANISDFVPKYIDVTPDKGAVELPCWFYTDKENEAKIHISGSVACDIPFSLTGSTKLYVRLQSAKPEGFTYSINGNKCLEFEEIKYSKGRNYDVNLDITINPDIVDVKKLQRGHVMIDFKVETTVLGIYKHTDVGINPQTLDFYFIEELGNSWVGFDPGTSGSCVAFGNPHGTLNAPLIQMVTQLDGSSKTSIVPSRLVLNKDLSGKNVENMVPGQDYQYGIEANRNWRASYRYPRFQSIKKLLGYKKADNDKIEVRSQTGVIKLTGVDLAHLLVKGLNKDLQSYISSLSSADQARYVDAGKNPRRAVVAVPNNYTLPKIVDMIDSVKRLGTFQEVRFVYEAEGILFNYLRKTYGSKQNGSETIVVYDMGGATINLTVFRIDYIPHTDGTHYNITTLGRIGYAVGGDNIDVALMEHIFDSENTDPEKRHLFQKEHKTDILESILSLKKNLIYANNPLHPKDSEGYNKNLDKIGNSNLYTSFQNEVIRGFGTVTEVETENNNFAKLVLDWYIGSKEMEQYVYSKVEDAVKEIMQYPEVASLSKIDKVIFAGRSTMFPQIKKKVKTILEQKSNVQEVRIFNNEEIKTAVAYGACWYGIYNGVVTLDNSRLSSAYGFKLTTPSDSGLHILLNQNSRFGLDNMAKNDIDISSLFNGDGQVVSFYQVMGSGRGADLLSESNRHKVNFLTGIPVRSETKNIKMEVGRNNVANCMVTFDTGQTITRSDADVETRDITEENDWAYIFATTDYERVSTPSHPTPQNASNTYQSPEKFSHNHDVRPNKKRH